MRTRKQIWEDGGGDTGTGTAKSILEVCLDIRDLLLEKK